MLLPSGRPLVAAATLLSLVACGPAQRDDREPDGSAVASAREEPAAARARTPSLWTGPPVDNVVLITIDTLRWDSLGYVGVKPVDTPAIDALAASGWIFEEAHAHNVVTLPSHANILSGRYPFDHGIRENSGYIFPSRLDSAATLLAAEGFAAAAVVGAFPLSSRYGLDRGFDLYDDEFSRGWGQGFDVPERSGDAVVEASLAWWNRNQGRRRFLWAHLYDPHAPYEPPEPWASRYPESAYLGEVAATDAYLAPLLEAVTAAGDGRTLVVLTSDHGEALGDHGEATHGFFVYESTLKVPLVIWAPGLEPRRWDYLARHVDLLPTMLEAAGVAVPDGLPGSSLWSPPVEGLPRDSYLEALSANLNRGWAPLRGLMRDRKKLISLPIPEFYDLANDPAELDNLFELRRAEAQTLVRALPSESTWPPDRGEVTEKERQALASLGYLSSNAPRKASYGVEDDPKNLVEVDAMLFDVIGAISEGRLQEAEVQVREAIARRPMALGYKLLAKIQLATHRRDEAIDSLEKAVATGFADAGVFRELGLSLIAAGRAQEAVRLLSTVGSQADPDNLNALASALIETGQLDRAGEALDRALAIEPRHPITHETQALLALRREDWAGVQAAAERALSIDPTLSLAWNYMGGAFYNQGQIVKALDAWQKSVDNDGTNYDAMFNIAVVAGSIGDRARARAALRRFVREAPSSTYGPDIQRARAWLAELGG